MSAVWRLLALSAAIVAPLSATVPLPDLRSRTAVEHYMRACEIEWAALDVTRDPSRVKDCIADDYQGVSSHNKVVNKVAATGVDPGRSESAATQVDYVHFRHPTPTLTIAQGGETATRKDGSRRTLIWNDIWLLRNGRWQIVASQDNVLTDTRK